MKSFACSMPISWSLKFLEMEISPSSCFSVSPLVGLGVVVAVGVVCGVWLVMV